jgi:hypothetical protein
LTPGSTLLFSKHNKHGNLNQAFNMPDANEQQQQQQQQHHQQEQ